ncbi:MAG: S16 family serine protease, partial [Candidatus Micrarchaeaceae archaeon]
MKTSYYKAGIFGVAAFTFIIAMALMASPLSYAQTLVGSAQMHAPAVITSNNTGVLTLIHLSVYRGNGTVNVSGPEEVGASTVDSAITAAKYAAEYLGLDFYNYSFNYTILNSNSVNVSGPSAGGVMTVLAISALTGRHLPNDFTMTGTISSNGSIGLIGGVYDKASAAKAGGMKFILVPATQKSSSEEMLYALVQDEFGLPLVQVANVSEALQY